MSTKELRRVEVFSQVRSRALRLVDAAEMLSLSYRQTKRLWWRYRLARQRGRACAVFAPTPPPGSGPSLQALRGERDEATETAAAGTGGGRPRRWGRFRSA